mgnify:CR=1 FL=1
MDHSLSFETKHKILINTDKPINMKIKSGRPPREKLPEAASFIEFAISCKEYTIATVKDESPKSKNPTNLFNKTHPFSFTFIRNNGNY